jgi:hypothetical protein
VIFFSSDSERIVKNNRRHNLTGESRTVVEPDKLTISVDPGLLNQVLEILSREFKVETTESLSIYIGKR